MEDFEAIRQKAEILYKTYNYTYCPFFKERIAFNALGLEHIKFKRRDKARVEQDQYMRFKLLHLVPDILSTSHTLQGKLEMKKFEQVRMHNRTESVLKFVTYYEFIALIKRDRLKIIVKQIENGQKFFWSIIPFWGMNTNTKSRLFHEGIPEED